MRRSYDRTPTREKNNTKSKKKKINGFPYENITCYIIWYDMMLDIIIWINMIFDFFVRDWIMPMVTFFGLSILLWFFGGGGGGRMLQVIIEFVWSVDCEERMRSKRICCLSHWSFELCLYRSRKKMKRRGEGVRDLFVARMKQLFWIWGPKKNEQQQHLQRRKID